MKKWLSLLLALVMVCLALTAMAEQITIDEQSDYFDASFTVPQGAVVSQKNEGDVTAIDIQSAHDPSVHYHFVVAPGEDCAGRNLADLTEDEKDILASMLTDNMAQPAFSYTEMPNGKLMLIAEETTADNDFAYYVTLCNGYFFSMYVAREDYSELKLEDVTIAIEMLNSLDVTILANSNAGGQDSQIAGMINPWTECTMDEAAAKLGAALEIDVPEGYGDVQCAYLNELFADTYEAVRIVYVKGDDMFRVHVCVPKSGQAEFEFSEEGAEKIAAAEGEAYYMAGSSLVVYYAASFEISIDAPALINADSAASFVGAVRPIEK